MNAAPPEVPPASDYPTVSETPWSLGRWAFWVLLAFAAHIGLFLGLGNHKPIPPRPVKNAVSLQPVLGRNETLELQDPTVFAGPHPRGFAASTWLQLPHVPIPVFRWNDSPRLLALAVDQLGTLSLNQDQADARAVRVIEIAPQPVTTILPPLSLSPGPEKSTVRITGSLTERKWENAPAALPLQRAQENLTNTIVQVTVDETGRVFSPVLLPPGSGSKDADQLALKTAAAARFASQGKTPQLTVGILLFEWQMEAPTNGNPPNAP
ncbi:MAG: hypothetical protein QM813_12320 [Verrucomicrobiota bacterium]